ncbi:histone H1-like [Prosopis cineraria]|uniref:histone H1-like n=1 Tax=Prosopis cineraria TaxID=364024 RepID=UPI0024102A39|nr:histone H1-like [Prosopis cineraria]
MAKANAKEKFTSAVHHPPYFHMIADAISTLNDRTGSSQQAITKFIEDKHSPLLPPNFRTLLSVQLKKFVKSERLFKVKNSFKISSSEKTKTAKPSKKGATPAQKAAKKIAEKGLKTKRLSHAKTPEALKKAHRDAKKKSMVSSAGKDGKVKRLSQVKTPEAMKKKKTKVTPLKGKTASIPIKPSRPAKKVRK